MTDNSKDKTLNNYRWCAALFTFGAFLNPIVWWALKKDWAMVGANLPGEMAAGSLMLVAVATFLAWMIPRVG